MLLRLIVLTVTLSLNSSMFGTTAPINAEVSSTQASHNNTESPTTALNELIFHSTNFFCTYLLLPITLLALSRIKNKDNVPYFRIAMDKKIMPLFLPQQLCTDAYNARESLKEKMETYKALLQKKQELSE